MDTSGRARIFPVLLGALVSVACLLAAGLGAAWAGPAAATSGETAVSPRAMAAYSRVAARVKVSAEALCRERAPEGGASRCNFTFAISGDFTAPPNAFQTRSSDGQPMIIVTARFLEQLADEHQIALVLSHEAAHHMAGHIDRMNRPGRSDAFLPGAGKSQGKALELEADRIGTFIAEAAGYDPQRAARIFGNTQAGHARKSSGSSSHPAPSERLAVISAASAEIARQRAAGRTPRPFQ